MTSLRALVATLLVCCLSVTQVSAQFFAPDVSPNDPYAEAIEYIQERDIADGYPDGTFRPTALINRAEITKILMESQQIPTGGSYCFADVQNQWFAPYVCGARVQHVVQGYPDGTFRPDRPVTFAEAASLVAKLYAGEQPTHGREWFDAYVDVLADWDAIPPTVTGPHAPLRRGEMAYIIWRAEVGGNDDYYDDEYDNDYDYDNYQNDNDNDYFYDDYIVPPYQQPVRPEIRPETSLGDPVLYWNDIALQANANDHTGTYGNPEQGGPGSSSLALAVVHVAIYDALNSIDRSHQPIIALVPVQAEARVSADAAVATAAHKTLVALFPAQRSVFNSALTRHMDLIPSSSEKILGIGVGDAAATQVLQSRINDNSVTNYVHQSTALAGKHRVDPINPTQPFLGPKWGNVRPFVLQSGTQFRAQLPPDMTSPEYAAAFNEVKSYGGDGVTTPTIRTQDQTNIGLFWAYDGVKKIGTPPRLYNQITRVIAQQKGNTVAQNARLFALINIVQADGGIVAWESKYHHDVWRPIVGIREADVGTGPSGAGDNNPLTAGDVNWTPLGAPMSNMTSNNFTPPFPAYPSGHATFGTAVFRAIERFYGTDEIAFTFVSDELNGVTTDNKGVVRPYAPRSFARLSDANRENAQSRVYLGVHWQFDQVAGMKLGREVADYVFDNALRPVAR